MAKRKQILKDFNFERVHEIMTEIGWVWATPNPLTMGVPSISELKQEAKRLLNELKKEKLKYVSTGGFTATRIGKDYQLFWGIDSVCIGDY